MSTSVEQLIATLATYPPDAEVAILSWDFSGGVLSVSVPTETERYDVRAAAEQDDEGQITLAHYGDTPCVGAHGGVSEAQHSEGKACWRCRA